MKKPQLSEKDELFANDLDNEEEEMYVEDEEESKIIDNTQAPAQIEAKPEIIINQKDILSGINKISIIDEESDLIMEECNALDMAVKPYAQKVQRFMDIEHQYSADPYGTYLNLYEAVALANSIFTSLRGFNRNIKSSAFRIQKLNHEVKTEVFKQED